MDKKLKLKLIKLSISITKKNEHLNEENENLNSKLLNLVQLLKSKDKKLITIQSSEKFVKDLNFYLKTRRTYLRLFLNILFVFVKGYKTIFKKAFCNSKCANQN